MLCKDVNDMYVYFNLFKYEVFAYVNFIRQTVLSACLEIIALRIAAWLVEIPGYVIKSRAAVMEAV